MRESVRSGGEWKKRPRLLARPVDGLVLASALSPQIEGVVFQQWSAAFATAAEMRRCRGESKLRGTSDPSQSAQSTVPFVRVASRS